MKYLNYIFSISLVATIFLACTKTGGAAAADDLNQIDQNDDIFPVLTVNKPAGNQVYASGDSIVVQGFVTDNKVMYKGTVKIINDATGITVKNEIYETHFLQRIDFYVAYKATVSSVTNYTIAIEFQDHGANMVTQTLKVKVNP